QGFVLYVSIGYTIILNACHPERSASVISFARAIKGAESKDPDTVSRHDTGSRHSLENSLTLHRRSTPSRGPSTTRLSVSRRDNLQRRSAQNDMLKRAVRNESIASIGVNCLNRFCVFFSYNCDANEHD